MKKILALTLVCIMTLSCAFSVVATARHEKTGDASLDYIVNIHGATAIQKYSSEVFPYFE